MRLAIEHRQSGTESAGGGRSADHGFQQGHRRHYELRSWIGFVDKRCSLKEPICQVDYLGLAAARQKGHHRGLGCQAQLRTCLCPVWLHRDHLGQRVSDISGGNTLLVQQRRLKRKNAQHMIDAVPDFLQPLGAPGPHRGADKVQCLDALAFQGGFQIKVEVRCVHPNEDVGALGQQAIFELLADANDLAVAAQHVPAKTMH
ncbi:hypothetical protein GALL_449630 [mine drainage metagenome]|uniref:Uncharacterized protein n=1 Tax=mine drainage metagenome TaxID=410659 RepID=A0A1J5PP91_9ZZZZ